MLPDPLAYCMPAVHAYIFASLPSYIMESLSLLLSSQPYIL